MGDLLRLRRTYPMVTIRWDRHNDRPVVGPLEVARSTPGLVDDLAAVKTRVVPILQWEVRHGEVVITPAQEELLWWLHVHARPDLWPGTLRLRPWTGVVLARTVLDGLRVEAALGPAGPSWRRVLEDLATLRSMDLAGVL